jgi:hypothetical protein
MINGDKLLRINRDTGKPDGLYYIINVYTKTYRLNNHVLIYKETLTSVNTLLKTIYIPASQEMLDDFLKTEILEIKTKAIEVFNVVSYKYKESISDLLEILTKGEELK